MATTKNYRSLTRERASEYLHYDAETGIFRWRVNSGNACIGKIAGTVCGPDFYRQICVCGFIVKAHRLAWLFCHGQWPEHEVDHINRVRDDNRISNLRAVERRENRFNLNRYSSNSSGTKGVYWNKRMQRWHAQISADGKKHHLGLFDTLDAASAAYLTASARLHGDYGSAG